jgi:L-cystine uptake protein TcyP (sodium:dicarboxylate symporter family)
LVIIPIVIGIVEVLKRAGLPNKYSPLVSLVLGLFFGLFFIESFKEGLIVGMMVGLSATGLYSGSKNLMQINKNDQSD